MDELTTLETTLLNGLTEKYAPLKSHLPHLRVAKRQKAGFSLYVYFAYVDFNEETTPINALFSDGQKIVISQLKEGLSYVVDVTAGRIEYLEFSSYKEDWDGKINDYQLMEPDANP